MYIVSGGEHFHADCLEFVKPLGGMFPGSPRVILRLLVFLELGRCGKARLRGRFKIKSKWCGDARVTIFMEAVSVKNCAVPAVRREFHAPPKATLALGIP